MDHRTSGHATKFVYIDQRLTRHTVLPGGNSHRQSYDDGPDWFELHITVVIDNLRIPFSRFRKHILEEKHEYALPDGRIILLPEEWFSKYANLMEIGMTRGKNIS